MIGVIPVFLSSLLIISAYEDVAEQIVERLYENDSEMMALELEFIQTITSENKILLSIIVSICLVITLFLAVYLSKNFTLPLKHVTRAVGQLARGDLTVRLVTTRTDEFGDLAIGFNNMAQALFDTRRNLEQANELLEKRVLERTAELTTTNVELRKTAEKTYESNRVKNEFLANMSHELRTPLNAIIGYADLMSDGIYGKLNEEQEDSLSKVRHNSKILLRLINDVLDLARLDSGGVPLMTEEFSPVELVEQTMYGVRALFDNKGISLAIDAGADLPTMVSDRGKIQQVLLNLLSNALKFTEKGEVTVRIYTVESGAKTSFEVKDTGIGIASEFHDLIFDQFRQLDGSSARLYGGTGLGLSISKKIASILDGELSLKSDQGQGSAFTLIVPTVLGESKPQEASDEWVDSSKPLVVAIDDDLDVLKHLTDMLEPEGFRVARCTDGDQGIRKAKELLPLAITLDIIMPYRDGWSVLRELKSNPRTCNIPVIIISIIDERPEGFKLGASDYLIKPIDHQYLAKRLRAFAAKGDDLTFGET